MSNEYIDLNFDDFNSGKTKVKVFNLLNDGDVSEYETILNSDNAEIISETPPSPDKIGRVITTVK